MNRIESRKYIVDTSIWIEYFKNNPQVIKVVEDGLMNGNAHIMGPIVSELLQGSKTRQEFDKLRLCIDAVPCFEYTFDDCIKAGEISFGLRKAGITIPLTDSLIGAVAINRDAEVYTLDKLFDYIPEIRLTRIE